MNIIKRRCLCEARKAALDEAVNTGGAIIPISAVESPGDEVVLIGSVKVQYIDYIDDAPVSRTLLSGLNLSNLYITDSTSENGLLGYLTIQRPITMSGNEIQEDSDEVNVAIIPNDYDGDVRTLIRNVKHCKRCNEVIPKERLQAIPSAVFCIECQIHNEGGRNERRNHGAYQDVVIR